MNRQLTLLLAVALGAVLMSQSGLMAVDTATAELATLLLLLSGGPAVLWLWGGMRHLPVFEVYAFMHLIYYWQPAGKAGGTVLSLPQEERAVFLGAVSVFLAFGAVVNWAMLRSARPPAKGQRLWDREVPAMKGSQLPWLLLGFWLLYSTLFQYGTIWSLVPGTLLPLVRALCVAAGMLGVFVTAHRVGEGGLHLVQKVAFVATVAAGTLLSFASGYLAVGTVFVGNAFFAYMIGARRLPVVSLTLFLLFVSFLNYGKQEMRARYWAMGESADDLVELYSHWFKSSWEQFNLPADRRGAATSAFERANLTEVTARVITQSPYPLPFLGGKTYLDSLQLLVPRLIWPDRPSLHVIMNELGLRYGIHMDVESTESTMISIGQVGEAWANGGWLGVSLAGAFFGMFYALAARLAGQRKIATIGFLFGMSFVGFAANLEHLAGTLLMTFYQTAIATLVLLYWFSRRTFVPLMPPKPWVRSVPEQSDPAQSPEATRIAR